MVVLLVGMVLLSQQSFCYTPKFKLEILRWDSSLVTAWTNPCWYTISMLIRILFILEVFFYSIYFGSFYCYYFGSTHIFSRVIRVRDIADNESLFVKAFFKKKTIFIKIVIFRNFSFVCYSFLKN